MDLGAFGVLVKELAAADPGELADPTRSSNSTAT